MSGALENVLIRPKTVITLMLVMVIAGIFTFMPGRIMHQVLFGG